MLQRLSGLDREIQHMRGVPERLDDRARMGRPVVVVGEIERLARALGEHQAKPRMQTGTLWGERLEFGRDAQSVRLKPVHLETLVPETIDQISADPLVRDRVADRAEGGKGGFEVDEQLFVRGGSGTIEHETHCTHQDGQGTGRLECPHQPPSHRETHDMTTNLPPTTARSRAFDLIRAAAIVRVCLWHGTGWAALTWIPALPVMFYLNGRFMAASIDRHGVVATLRGRMRRILYPYWVFAFVVLTVMYAYGSWRVESMGNALAWVFPLAVPEGAAWQGGWMTEPLWYVRTYLWLLITAVILNFLVRRGKLPLVLIWTGVAWVVAWSLGSQWWAVQNYLTFGACFMLGLFAARHRWRKIELLTIAVVGGVGVCIVAVNRLPAGGVVNNDHALHLSLGLVLLAVLEAARPRLEAVLANAKRWHFVAAVNERSVSIYLWHPILIGAGYLAMGRIAQGAILRIGALVVAAAMLWSLLALVGMVEDYAAHKTTGRPVLQHAALRFTSGAVAAGVFMLATPAAGRYDLPPVPSQAPPNAAAYAPGPNDLDDVLLGYSSTPESQGDAVPGVYARPFERSPDGGTDLIGSNAKPSTPVESVAPNTAEVQPATTGPAPDLRPIPRWESLAGVDDITAETVAEVVREWVFDAKVGGVEVAVLRPGVGRFEVAIDSDGSRIAMRDTVPLASITKTFTAALLLRAVDDGLLDLYEPIGKIEAAPWFTMTEEITAGQLLTHRSGLVNYTETGAWERDWREVDGWKSALEAVMDEGFSSTPGSVVSYSSTNYIVAGLLAAQIYKMPIEELIETRLLNPLGLDSTFVGLPVPGSPGTGTGNMRASLTDVARWGMTLWRDQRVLGTAGNARLRDVDPSTMIGYGSFAWCPCRSGAGGLKWAAIGANGAEATVRYYPGIDLVLAMRIPGGVDVRAERLITGIIEAIEKS